MSDATKQTENKQNVEKHQTLHAAKRKQSKSRKIRLIPIWLRFLIIFMLLILSLVIGAMIGYGVIGDGALFDVFKKSTWQHMIDFVSLEE